MRSLSIATLSQLPLFQGLTADELVKLVRYIRMKNALAGTRITLAGQSIQEIYIVLSGVVHLQMDQLNGTVVILAILETGEILNVASLGEQTEYPTSAVAKEDTTLLWLDYVVFRECLGTMPTLSFNLSMLLARRLYLTYKKLRLLAAKEVHERVAGHLIDLAEKYGQTSINGEIYIHQRLTQSELADHVGASRVRVNQAIALFKQQHYISIDQHLCVTIHNSFALMSVAGLF